MARKNKDITVSPEEMVVVKAAEQKERYLQKRIAKRNAIVTILDFLSKRGLTKEVADEVAVLTPGLRMGGGERGGISKLGDFTIIFSKNSEINGLQIYQDFGIGQDGMRKVARDLIKKLKPEERIWVHYDKPSDVYSVKGVGSEPPEGWTGYRPVEVEDVEIV